VLGNRCGFAREGCGGMGQKGWGWGGVTPQGKCTPETNLWHIYKLCSLGGSMWRPQEKLVWCRRGVD